MDITIISQIHAQNVWKVREPYFIVYGNVRMFWEEVRVKTEKNYFKTNYIEP